VDLEPVTEAQDIELLHATIGRHAEVTASPRAKWVLGNWAAMLPRFVKVFPHEYKRVMGVPRAAKVFVPAPPEQAVAQEVARG